MAASPETTSVAEKLAQSSILNLKANQNLILDLDPTKYDGFLQPIVECLCYSPLVIALTKSEIVPMVHLSKAYSTSSYQKGEEMITFEIFNKKINITKSRLCTVLGLPQGRDLVNPKIVSNFSILEMFYQMGYKEVLTNVSKFKKPNLLPMSNGLFTLIFKSFYDRVIGSDCASKLFTTIMYGIFSRINFDYGSVLWAQLVKSNLLTTQHSEISCARFWTIVVQRAIDKYQIPMMKDSLKSWIPTFHTTKIIIFDN